MLRRLIEGAGGVMPFRSGVLVHLLAAVGVLIASIAGNSYSAYSLWQRYPLAMLFLWAGIVLSLVVSFWYPKSASWVGLPLASGAHMMYALSAVVPIVMGVGHGMAFSATEYERAGALMFVHLGLSLSATVWAVQSSHGVLVVVEGDGGMPCQIYTQRPDRQG